MPMHGGIDDSQYAFCRLLRYFQPRAVRLADPQLQLLSATSAVLAQNVGWASNPQIASAAASVGAFAWKAGGLDSAVLATLPPGAYTAEVSGATGDVGVALIEIYEVP